MYSPSQYMYMVAALLFCVVDCTFVLRDYFFGTRTVVQLQRCQKMTSNEYGKISRVNPQKTDNITTAKQSTKQPGVYFAVCSVDGIYRNVSLNESGDDGIVKSHPR